MCFQIKSANIVLIILSVNSAQNDGQQAKQQQNKIRNSPLKIMVGLPDQFK